MVFSCLCCCHSSQKSLFACTNRINLLNLKESSDRLVIVAKGFLKVPNLHMLIKKSLSLPRSLALRTFGKMLIVFSTKANLLYLLYLTVLSSASDKASLFTKNFSKNSNLGDSGISLTIFPSRTNLKLHNIFIYVYNSQDS